MTEEELTQTQEAEPQPELNAEQLMQLAREAERQAESAAQAADTASRAAKLALEIHQPAESKDSEEGQKFLEARLALANQAAAAATASLNAQISARDAAAAAICKAEKSLNDSLRKKQAAELEVKRILLLVEEADEKALAAQDAVLEAEKAAEDQAQKALAYKKALMAAKILEEEAGKTYATAEALLHDTRREAIETAERLESAQQRAASAEGALAELQAALNPPVVEEAPPPPKKKRSIGRKIWFFAKLVLIALVLALLLRAYVFDITRVEGVSMAPYLQDGDHVVTSKLHYVFGEPQRGDIVILNSPDLAGELYVKRIVGLPNERITISGGKVYIDGKVLNEPYLQDVDTSGEIDRVLENNHYFVLGDNRPESHDSRSPAVDAISIDAIRGKAVLRVYPWDAISILD